MSPDELKPVQKKDSKAAGAEPAEKVPPETTEVFQISCWMT